MEIWTEGAMAEWRAAASDGIWLHDFLDARDVDIGLMSTVEYWNIQEQLIAEEMGLV